MKFIHLADAHLDSPFLGLSFLPSNKFNEIKNSTYQSFEKIVDLAIEEKVDLFLMAGDNFDSIHPSPKSQLFLKDQLDKLVKNKIQVVMILGNHDYIEPDKLILPDSPYFKLLGKDEKVESSNFKTKSGFAFTVNGFSYRHNHIEEDKIAEFPKKQDSVTFGLMHAGERTTNPSQNNYAPFKVEDIKKLNYDYFALGHIHLRQNLNEDPLISYSGNIQGKHINEENAKGCLLGEIDEQTKQVKTKFVATAPIIWKKVSITLDHSLTQNELLDKIIDALKESSNDKTLFGITINGAQYLSDEMIEFISNKDTWLGISNKLENSSYLVKVYFEQSNELSLNTSDQKAFKEAQDQVLAKDNFLKLAKPLKNKNAVIEKIIMDDSFYDEVKKMAKVKLSQQLRDIRDETDED